MQKACLLGAAKIMGKIFDTQDCVTTCYPRYYNHLNKINNNNNNNNIVIIITVIIIIIIKIVIIIVIISPRPPENTGLMSSRA